MKSMTIAEPMKSKEIAKKTGLSWQTTSAELTNLHKYRVVDRSAAGYTLTEKGYFLITRISYLPDFDGWTLEDFVAKHQIHRIPSMILKDFGIWKETSQKEFILQPSKEKSYFALPCEPHITLISSTRPSLIQEKVRNTLQLSILVGLGQKVQKNTWMSSEESGIDTPC
jgi:predicted transcriptional regulator